MTCAQDDAFGLLEVNDRFAFLSGAGLVGPRGAQQADRTALPNAVRPTHGPSNTDHPTRSQPAPPDTRSAYISLQYFCISASAWMPAAWMPADGARRTALCTPLWTCCRTRRRTCRTLPPGLPSDAHRGVTTDRLPEWSPSPRGTTSSVLDLQRRVASDTPRSTRHEPLASERQARELRRGVVFALIQFAARSSCCSCSPTVSSDAREHCDSSNAKKKKAHRQGETQG